MGVDALGTVRAAALLDPFAGKPRPHADTYYTRLSFCLPNYPAHLADTHRDASPAADTAAAADATSEAESRTDGGAASSAAGSAYDPIVTV